MKLIINCIPPTINKYIGRTNFWEYHADKTRIHNLVKMSTVGYNPKFKKCKMIVTYYFKDKRRHDPSNYDKMLLDALVEANIIEDDNYNVIQEFTTIGKVDKDKPRTEIEIKEME